MGKKEQVGIRIRTMRKSRQMTQEDLAKAIGQSPSSITMYETGRRSPDYETLEALADVFNVPMSALVSNEDPPDEPEPIKDDTDAPDLSELDLSLLNMYHSLNPRGQKLLFDRAEELKVLYGKGQEDQSDGSVQVI